MKNPTGRTGFWCLLFLGGIGLFLPTLGAAAGVEVWNPLTRTPQGIVVSLDRLQGQPPLRILPDRLVVRSLETEEGPAIREAVSAELHRRAPGAIFARVDYVPCQVIADAGEIAPARMDLNLEMPLTGPFDGAVAYAVTRSAWEALRPDGGTAGFITPSGTLSLYAQNDASGYLVYVAPGGTSPHLQEGAKVAAFQAITATPVPSATPSVTNTPTETPSPSVTATSGPSASPSPTALTPAQADRPNTCGSVFGYSPLSMTFLVLLSLLGGRKR